MVLVRGYRFFFTNSGRARCPSGAGSVR